MTNLLHLGGTDAANWNLLLQIALGIALVVGTLLARRKHFGAHRAVQTTAVIVNLVLVVVVMVPSFLAQHVLRHALAKPGRPYFAVAMAHGLVGTAATLLSLYVVLSAGTALLPAKLRIQSYKAWMRTTLVLWLVALALGLATFHIWYGGAASATAAEPEPAAAPPPTAIVRMVDFKYEPETLTVPAGTTVTWVDEVGIHSVRSETEKFESDPLAVGQRYQHRFDRPGRYSVYCTLHGKDTMAGTIEVVAH
jgi:plastocyanin